MGRPKQLSLEFEVKSTHPNIPTPTLLKEIKNTLPQFEADLSRDRTVERATLKREGTFPIDSNTAMVALGALVGTITGDMAEEFVKKFADDAYDWLKKKWPWASFSLKSTAGKDASKSSANRARKKVKKVRKSPKRKR